MKNITQFLGEVRVELSRIEWPSFEEFIGSTIIALIIICAFALYLGFIDRIFALAARYIFAYGVR